MAAMLPVEITAKLLADAFAQDFWALLEELRSFGWDGGDCWNFGNLPPAEPVVPVDTTTFLRCSDDDRAWWWRPDGPLFRGDECLAGPMPRCVGDSSPGRAPDAWQRAAGTADRDAGPHSAEDPLCLCVPGDVL